MNLSAQEFDDIRRLVQQHCGLALSPEKKYLVRARLEPLVRKYAMLSFGDVATKLRQANDGLFRDEVVAAMVTHETSFHRDGHPFDALRRTILPMLSGVLKERRDRSGIPFPRIRIWSVASSTGQEPYSIAMSVLDFLEANRGLGWTPHHFWILASDISEPALSIARAGAYTDFEIERGLTIEQRQKYLKRVGDQWEIVPAVRQLVEFRRLNILDNVSDLTGFDLLFCRNLLIYFDDATRHLVLQKLAMSLNPGGFLFLGAAEHLPAQHEKTWEQMTLGKTVLFRKIGNGMIQ